MKTRVECTFPLVKLLSTICCRRVLNLDPLSTALTIFNSKMALPVVGMSFFFLPSRLHGSRQVVHTDVLLHVH